MPDSTQVYRWIVGAAWHNVGVVESNKRHVTWTALTETNSFTFANCLSQFLLTVVWRIYLSTVLRHFLSVFSFLILITFIFDCVLIFWQEIRFQSLAVIVGERRGILSNIPYLLVFKYYFDETLIIVKSFLRCRQVRISSTRQLKQSSNWRACSICCNLQMSWKNWKDN